MSDRPTLSFQGGTLVITHRPQADPPGAPFQWIKGKWRCEAYHYPAIQHLDERDVVPRWQPLDCVPDDSRQPHDYQQEAIDRLGAGRTARQHRAAHRRRQDLRRHPGHSPCQPLDPGGRPHHRPAASVVRAAGQRASTPRSVCTTAVKRSSSR